MTLETGSLESSNDKLRYPSRSLSYYFHSELVFQPARATRLDQIESRFTIVFLVVTLLCIFAPKLISNYATRFKIGHGRFLSLYDLEWSSQPFTIQDAHTCNNDQADQKEGVRISVKSIGIRFGSNEGSRCQWIALRVDSPAIKIPKRRTRSNSFDSSSEPDLSSAEASYCYRRSRVASGASSTSQLSGLSKSDAPGTNLLRTISDKWKEATSSLIRQLPPQFHPTLRILRKVKRYRVDLSQIGKVRCSIKTGLQLSRGDNGKLCGWIVVKKLQIHKVTGLDDIGASKDDNRPNQAGRHATAAFSFPGCIELSASAGLDPVIGLASIWAGTKARGYTPRIPSSSFPTYSSSSVKNVEVTSEFCFAGRNISCFDKNPVPTIDLTLREGTVQTLVEEVSFDLWRPHVLASLVAFTQTFTNFRQKSHDTRAKDKIEPPSTREVPIPRDIAFSIAASKFRLRAAGFDPQRDSTIARGTQLVVSNAPIECFRQPSAQPGLHCSPHRSRLDLQEDIRVQANTQLVHNPEFEICILKCAMKKIKLFVIPDLMGSIHSNRFSRLDSPSDVQMFHYRSPSIWDNKTGPGFRKNRDPQSPIDSTLHESQDVHSVNKEVSIVEMNRFACRTTLQLLKQAEKGEDELILAVETGLITFQVDAFHIYCALIAVSTLLNLGKKISSKKPEDSKRPPKRLPIGIRAEISRVNFHMFLSHQVPMFIEMRRLTIQKSSKLGLDARWDILLIAGRSVTSPGRWDDILKVKTCKIKIVQVNPLNSATDPTLLNRGWHPFVVLIEGDAARLRIPFKFIIAEVIESVSLLVKTTKQLTYQFIRGGGGSILQPVIESPKKLPEIRIKFRIVCVQAEDDPFENKLNAIRRAGKEEVKDRLARDESFQQKIQGMNEPKKHTPKETARPRRSCDSYRQSDRSSTDSLRNDDSFSFESGTHSSHISITQAAQRLNEHNGAAWIKRIRNALAEQERQEDAVQRQLYGHTATKLSDVTAVSMLPVTKATPLVHIVYNSIRIALYKADFEQNENGLMDYLHNVGKGLPKDTKFSLIVPMHISWQMEGATMRLRDFPLYLFSLPRPQAQNGHQQERDLSQYTWQFESDFVIADEMCGIESIRTLQSIVIPPHHSLNVNHAGQNLRQTVHQNQIHGASPAWMGKFYATDHTRYDEGLRKHF
ncbi:hypothetical protein PSTG_01196 [Puccinia striiformis f. sp. tritici PST-78]|uniref:FMP27 SW motif-containing RBG unit domain-containing protein n=1 Tax=Puccinia striiformis f. sp. tritici PST-78 TaxID=1165861 RepID=A0A0L0W2R5_9BASI|nr:hypothetical protein PSTG_01196 [Puccinia striiformis f. sp. tritici PST-78]